MAGNFGYIYGFDTTYPDASAGTNNRFSGAGSNGAAIGQTLNSGQYTYYVGYMEFDTSLISGTPDDAYMDFQWGDASIGTTLHCAIHDYGSTLDTSDWLTPTDLSGLSILQSWTITPTGSTWNDRILEFDLSTITLGNFYRLVFFTEEQRTATAPSSDLQYGSLRTELVLKYNYVDPGTAGGYQEEVAADSPTLWWRLDENSGTVAADNSGNGHTGVYTNSPTLGVASLLAENDLAASFSQPNNSKVVGNDNWNGTNFTNGLTIEGLFQVADTIGGVDSEYFVVCGFEGQIEIDLEFWAHDSITDDGILAFFVYDGTSQSGWVWGYFQKDTPMHVVGAIPADGNLQHIVLFINGEKYMKLEPDTRSVSLNFAYDTHFYAGGDDYNGSPPGDNVPGTVDEPALYPTKLSDTRIRTHSKAVTILGHPTFHETVGIEVLYAGLPATIIQDRVGIADHMRAHAGMAHAIDAVDIDAAFGAIFAERFTVTDAVGIADTFLSYGDSDSAYRDAVMADSPTGYWRLDETFGTLFHDRSGHGYHMTIGTADLGRPSMMTVFGSSDNDLSAHHTGGSSSFYNATTVFSSGVDYGDFAFEALVNVDSPGGSFQILGGLNADMFLRANKSGSNFQFDFMYKFGASQYGASTSAIYHYGTTYHVVCEWDGTNAIIYVDGTAVVSTPRPNGLKPPNNNGFAIGEVAVALDEVAFYDHALGQTRVTAHWHALSVQNIANTVAITGHLAIHGHGGFFAVGDVTGVSATLSAGRASAAGTIIYRVAKPNICGDPAFSPDGQTVCFAEKIGSTYKLSTVSRTGTGYSTIHTSTRPYSDPTFSFDGEFVLYSMMTVDPNGGHPQGQWKIEMIELGTGEITTIVNDSNANMHPSWLTATQIGFQRKRYGTDTTFHVVLADILGNILADNGAGEYPRLVQV